MNYWLFKTEPNDFSIEDLRDSAEGTEHWDGVRNYQARNFMRDEMKPGDSGFLYHSNCSEPGIVGIVKIESAAYPDHTAFDKHSKYYDPKSRKEEPRWYMVDVKYIRHLERPLSLKELKSEKQLTGMRLLQKGNRLSVMPISKGEWEIIGKLERRSTPKY